MYNIIYLDLNGAYLSVTGKQRSEIMTTFNCIESLGYTIITIYDYEKQDQLYRCSNYHLHRFKIIKMQNGSLSWTVKDKSFIA